MKVLNDEQRAVAINLAMDFEERQYNPYTMKGFVKEFCECDPEDLRPLFDFWRTTNSMTQRAYIAASYHMNSAIRV